MVALAGNPHYLLYSDASCNAPGVARWRFVLQAVGSDDQFSAGDGEFEICPSRLELLAVVRGLEALDQPSRVTLITSSSYVARGIRRGLTIWRDRQWQWERFGELVPIRDQDLWQRVDRALQIHKVSCLGWPGLEERQPYAAAGAHHWDEHSPAGHPMPGNPRGLRWDSQPQSLFCRTLGKLWEGVLAQITSLLWPAFTRTA